MITAKCSTCGAELPRRETLTVRSRILCEPCTTAFIEQYGEKMTDADIARNMDPTICNWCHADSGQSPHGEVATMPICEPCETRLRNWPFPGWIKISFVSLVVLGVMSFLANWRHVEGGIAARAAIRAMKAGDLDVALDRAQLANKKVPEFAEYRFLAGLMESISLISKDQSAAALDKLRKLDGESPGLPMIKRLMETAEVAIAFDQKNYDRFLELATQQNTANPNDRQLRYQLASATACKFAETGNEDFKQKTLDQLATLGDDRSLDETDYRQRILFRITTRRIIDKKQFQVEFPNGWKAEE